LHHPGFAKKSASSLPQMRTPSTTAREQIAIRIAMRGWVGCRCTGDPYYYARYPAQSAPVARVVPLLQALPTYQRQYSGSHSQAHSAGSEHKLRVVAEHQNSGRQRVLSMPASTSGGASAEIR